MKKSASRSILILSACLLTVVACHRSPSKAQPAATETIAPAVAPSSPNGADAMTQTVDVEDSRSEAEGGTVSSTTGTAKPTTLKKVVKGKKK